MVMDLNASVNVSACITNVSLGKSLRNVVSHFKALGDGIGRPYARDGRPRRPDFERACFAVAWTDLLTHLLMW